MEDLIIEKKVPSNIDAEKYILGSMLVDPGIATEFSSSLEENDFYYDNNKKIYRAIKNITGDRKELSVIALTEELKRNGEFDAVGGNDYIFDLINEVPVISEIDDYVSVLKDKSVQRSLLNAVKLIYDMILSGKMSLNSLLDKAEESIMNIIKKRSSSRFISMDRAVEKTFEIIESKRNQTDEEDKVLSGYKELDNVLHGLGRGSLIILAARPSIGKSTFALNIASNVAESGKKVAFFSLEMGYDQLVTKIFASESSINMDKIISGRMNENEMAKLLVTKNKIGQFPIFFDDESTTELNDIRNKCQQLKREGQLDLIIIDYLQLLSVGDGNLNRVNEVGKISRGLKIMARNLDVPVIALSQLSRSVEKQERADKTPILSDLRESGSIEQDADIVLFLHREKNTEENAKSFRSAKTDLIVAKNRNGETKTIKLIFNGAHSKFSQSFDDGNEEGVNK